MEAPVCSWVVLSWLPESVESIMIARVETVTPKEPLEHAWMKMVERNIGSVVVIEGNNPVGIITERDISRCLAKGVQALNTRVENIMSSPLITTTRSAGIEEIMQTMLKHGIRRLPVVDEGMLVGIVSDRDLLRWVLRIRHEPHISPAIREILDRQPFSKT